mmetsp:Transcript_9031/g.11652  ORF Transcript_9031/g.11652 Transcript_9031/m.11652 type:complete len:309 (-) Transcript_9031:537-1463(-)
MAPSCRKSGGTSCTRRSSMQCLATNASQSQSRMVKMIIALIVLLNNMISPSLAFFAAFQPKPKAVTVTDKLIFLESLDQLNTLNPASQQRTSLLNTMIQQKTIVDDVKNVKVNDDIDVTSSTSLKNPGDADSFSKVAQGTWKVIYAPHMTTISSLFNGSFDVSYSLDYLDDKQILRDDKRICGIITSHAKYEFPIIGTGYLSVSGTFGSLDDQVCRVDFDKAWVKPLSLGRMMAVTDKAKYQEKIENEKPFASLEQVPDGFVKDIVNEIGKYLFIESFALFPVSFLDENLIVFDFELLGTRICAKKID